MGPAAFLKGLKAEGVQQVAEQCAVGLQYLLKLGFSMAAPMRYGRPEDDGVEWPADAEGKARIVRLQGRRLLADLEAVATAFDELSRGSGRTSRGLRRQILRATWESSSRGTGGKWRRRASRRRVGFWMLPTRSPSSWSPLSSSPPRATRSERGWGEARGD